MLYEEKIMLLSLVFIFVVINGVVSEKTFKAAVYEHAVIDSFAADRPAALRIMKQNLEVLTEQARKSRLAVSMCAFAYEFHTVIA